MTMKFLQGDLVRLVAIDEQVIPDVYSRWSRDSGCWRLQDSRPSRPVSINSVKDWVEKGMDEESPDLYWFMIRTLDDDQVIGDISLDGVQWHHGESFVGIGIGERENWDCGYGTDAMGVILRYAFIELKLNRVSLNVFAYNPRAVRCYEKVGFRHEGFQREVLNRDGKRWDILYMGILRSEWLEHARGN